MIKLFFVSFIIIIGTVYGDVLNENDYCGVQNEDYLIYDFTGSVAVAGNGCNSQPNVNCLCAPRFDNSTLFRWQCNGEVEFGPRNGKVCPDQVPVIKKVGVNSDSFSESSVGVPVFCNTSMHPTGYPGDPSCGYSECEEDGGSFSAICGCVDFGNRTNDTSGSDDMEWVCLHSTCECSLPDKDDTPDFSVSTSTSPIYSPFIFVKIAFCIAFMMAY